MEGYIDTEDLPRLIEQNLSWSAGWDDSIKDYYAKAIEYYKDENGKTRTKTHCLNREITNAPKGTYVDHIGHEEHSSLDNRKINLRVTDNPKNSRNRNGKNVNNTTGYRNVILDKDTNKYIIMLCVDNIRFRVGKLYTDVHEAGRDAEMYRKQYYKEFAGIS